MKLKTHRRYVYGCLVCVLLLLGTLVVPTSLNLQGNGQLIYSNGTSAKTLIEHHVPFQFPLNNEAQKLILSIGNNKKIEQVSLLFSSYWLLFLEFEMIRFLDHSGHIIGETRFTETKGYLWKYSGVKQLEQYWISENNLNNMKKGELAPQLLKELSTLKGRFFSKKEQLYTVLKQLSYDTNWREREIIRKYSQKPHYQVTHHKHIIMESPHFSPLPVSQINLHFRPVIPTNLFVLFYHKCLVPFWLFFFFGGVCALGTLYALYTGEHWHLD
ncbi:MAG: hypothetical protein HQM14_06390 [SAR324 cluster bacterium]|nr:hypothetical protein [SAR324 cluster bacterium]